jgi:ATP-dependent Clp protease ATP-binding subunit ClpC
VSAEADISSNARTLLEAAGRAASERGLSAPGLNQWMCVVLGQCRGIAERVSPGYDFVAVETGCRAAVEGGDAGPATGDAAVVSAARARTATRGELEVTPRDIVAAVLGLAGYPVPDEAPAQQGAAQPAAAQPVAPAPSPSGAAAEDAPAPPAVPPATSKPTPTIEQFGRDLTREGREGKLQPIFGREREVETLLEVLCRTVKRNPLLLGPPGCGKTAIVEDLARRVAKGEVPAFMRNVRILAVETSALVSGTGIVGTFEERVRKIIGEASQPDVVLFLDEAHTLVEAGGRSGGLADILKPALSRGDLALIAATTDDEYRRLIQPDGALERRFQPVVVTEMSPEDTLQVLELRRDFLSAKRGVSVSDDVLRHLVDFAEENLRNRTFPDKALDLLEQCVANAVSHERSSVSPDDAEAVITRLVGLPAPPETALADLSQQLSTILHLEDGQSSAITRRLSTTTRGLDVRSWRPNLVVALTGPAAAQVDALARVFARTLYGSEERVVVLDLSPIKSPESLSMLVGSPPGYIGFGMALPIHDLARTPWTVVVVRGLDVCDVSASDVIAKALADGYLTDASGDRFYVSDAVVLVPSSTEEKPHGHVPLGFGASEGGKDSAADRRLLESLFGKSAAHVDVHVRELSLDPAADSSAWLSGTLLPGIAERYRRRGVELTWTPAVVQRLCELTSELDRHEAEHVAEDWVAEAAPADAGGKGHAERAVRLSVAEGKCVAKPGGASGASGEVPQP